MSKILADRVFRRYILFAVILMACAYAQLEFAFPAFAVDVAHASTRTVAWSLAAYAATIVVLQSWSSAASMVAVSQPHPSGCCPLKGCRATSGDGDRADRPRTATCQLAEVASAIRYLSEGHARGKVVVTIAALHAGV